MPDKFVDAGKEIVYICPQCEMTYAAALAGRTGFMCCTSSCIDKRIVLERLDKIEETEASGEWVEDEEEREAAEEIPEPEERIEPEEKVEAAMAVEQEAEEETLEVAKGEATYVCPECGKDYSVAQADKIGSFCANQSCFDQMVLLEKIPGAGESERTTISDEIGLGVILCDISGSMENFAFPDRRISKAALVAGSVARGIWDLVEEMVEPAQKNAYVALVFFSKDAELATDDDGLPFLKSIYEIREIFKSARDFGDFIHDAMRRANRRIPQNFMSDVIFGKDSTKHYTNINTALDFAYRLKNACLAGDLSEFGHPGRVKVIEDVCISPVGESVLVPNIRCLIYSDGEHNYPKDSEIVNPFGSDETSILLTTFIGPKTATGGVQMERIAGVCPKHGEKSFFSIKDPDEYQKLRGLFRMSSGVSGFCPSCMPKDI